MIVHSMKSGGYFGHVRKRGDGRYRVKVGRSGDGRIIHDGTCARSSDAKRSLARAMRRILRGLV